jgi:hypothetical protein
MKSSTVIPHPEDLHPPFVQEKQMKKSGSCQKQCRKAECLKCIRRAAFKDAKMPVERKHWDERGYHKSREQETNV